MNGRGLFTTYRMTPRAMRRMVASANGRLGGLQPLTFAHIFACSFDRKIEGIGRSQSTQSAAVRYGVSTSATNPTNVDTYLTAALVPNWNNVISVSVQLTFTNPLYVAANPQGQLPTITVQRYIAIMRQT